MESKISRCRLRLPNTKIYDLTQYTKAEAFSYFDSIMIYIYIFCINIRLGGLEKFAMQDETPIYVQIH